MSATRLDEGVVSDLRALVGEEFVVTDPDRLISYESDALVAYRHRPSAVVLPASTAEVSKVMRVLHRARAAVVPRGAGTGLSGGALALDGAVAIGTARMNRILTLDPESRVARVQSGIVNARLSEAAREHGLYYAPDPSSQTTCTLGGNVAENSGGPHCLKYGVTTRYVRGLTVVLFDGEVVTLGGAFRERNGIDLLGAVVGSEGCFGIVTEIEVALVPIPEAVSTLLAVFDHIEDAGHAVTDIIASGLLPAALEIIDRETIRAVESSVFAAGYPTGVGAALVVEFDGPAAGLPGDAARAEEACLHRGAREVRRAESDEERQALWKGRKKAFGAMGRIAPDLLVQDATVPRSRLPEVLRSIEEIAATHQLTVANVFHAGDGNLHPNILFDRRDAAQVEQVERASKEIMRVCVDAGGTITGEHGVGVDKVAYMHLVHGPEELAQMSAVKLAFDPDRRMNPGKVIPEETAPFDPGARRSSALHDRAKGGTLPPAKVAVSVLGDEGIEVVTRSDRSDDVVIASPANEEEAAALFEAVSTHGFPVQIIGNRAERSIPDGISLLVSTRRFPKTVRHEPADLTASVSASVTLGELQGRCLEVDQWLPVAAPNRGLRDAGSLGGWVSLAGPSPLDTRYGAVRDQVLGLRMVTGDGRVLRLGGRVVKNVAGFDLVRPMVGSRGSMGLITWVDLRLFPKPEATVRLVSRGSRAEELVPAARLVAASQLSPARVEIVEVEGDGAELRVTLHGSEATVQSERRVLEARVPSLEVDDGLGMGIDRTAAIAVRLRLPTARLGETVAHGRSVMAELTDGERTNPPVLTADVLSGRVVVRFDRSGAIEERVISHLSSVRAKLEGAGGGLTVAAAEHPLEATEGSDGPSALAQRVRACFDPLDLLREGAA